MDQKQRKKWIIYGLIGALVIGFFWYQSLRNHLVTLSESVDSSWAQVENQLQRRYDLIPNLVNTVKGYAKHEKELFENIAEARSKLAGARSVSEKLRASGQMESFLSRLLVVVERYPNLKSNTSFNRLMDELAGTENRVSVERRRFNENVKIFNLTIRKFPYYLLASGLNLKKLSYFESDSQSKVAPKVDFTGEK